MRGMRTKKCDVILTMLIFIDYFFLRKAATFALGWNYPLDICTPVYFFICGVFAGVAAGIEDVGTERPAR